MLPSIVKDNQFILGLSLGAVCSIVLAIWNRSKSCQTTTKNSAPIQKKIGKNTDLKMVIVVRKDAKLVKRELIAHSVTAAAEAFKKSLITSPNLVKQWQRWGQKKIAVKINSESELLALKSEADNKNLVNYLVRSSDKSRQNALVLAIGPDCIEDINVITGHLKLL